MTEIGTIMMFECAEQPGGAHVIEDHVIEEVIDPAATSRWATARSRRAPAANVSAALAALWNAVNDLALTHEHLVDYDV